MPNTKRHMVSSCSVKKTERIPAAMPCAVTY